ncbi:MAG: DUF1464 family protein [Candidatus Latescibacteria bacterium]|nr:DUF1464 family protein [Candidatus Latescibacterota bacterium]
MMRVAGIDPGTYSFDLFGMENDRRIIVDLAISSEEIFQNPFVLIEKLEELMPLDIIVGPSGYGIPLMNIENLTEKKIGDMIPLDTQVSVNEGIKNVLWEMKKRKMPVWFTPGVIHLKTVPKYRKWGRMDMGTADKVCCVALGIKNQSEQLNLPYEKTSFIYVEIGYGFTAVLGVINGRIVDGIGGTNGSLGFIACGGMDAELAIRLKNPTQDVVFKGGVRDFVGQGIEPKNLKSHPEAMTLLAESVEKDVASMSVAVPHPKQIILSGRLIGDAFIREELRNRLQKYSQVVRVNKPSKVAKEAACGAYIIGEGLLDGKYRMITEIMGIRD